MAAQAVASLASLAQTLAGLRYDSCAAVVAGSAQLSRGARRTRRPTPAGLSPRGLTMRQRSRAVVLLLVAFAALAPSADCARGKPAPAPPPPPPPPPSLLDAVKAVVVSAAAKLPSRAACLQFGAKVSRAALHFASSAVSASHKATAAVTVRAAS